MSELQKGTTPMSLIEMAVSNNMDIDKLSQLMDLQERWDKKQAKKAFFEAKNSFQLEKPEIVKTSGVSHDKGVTVKFSFAPLPDVQKLVDPVLGKFGLSYSWRQENDNGQIKIIFTVSHLSGHEESNELSSPKDSSGNKNDIQSMASTVSYLKRYTLMNGLGLSAGDDDGASSQMNRDEIAQLMREKLEALVHIKKGGIEPKTLARLNDILSNNEEASYKKAIKTLETL